MAELKKIRSSTVLEATIALLLVLIVAAIATVVFGRASVAGPSPAFIKAQSAIDSMMNLQSEAITIDHLTISKQVTAIPNTKSWQLRFTIVDRNGRLLQETNRIITE